MPTQLERILIDKENLFTDEQMKQFIANGYVIIKPDIPTSLHETISQKLDEVVAKEGLDELDTDGDGKLSFEEFYQFLDKLDDSDSDLLPPTYPTEVERKEKTTILNSMQNYGLIPSLPILKMILTR